MTMFRAALLFSCLACVVLPALGEDTPAGPPSIEQNWDDLAKDEPIASRALLRLAATPAPTVAFLKDRLRPLTLVREDLDAKLKDLASEDEKVWRPAFDYLCYFDPRLSVDLPTLMADTADAATRARLVEVLSDYDAGQLAGKSVNLLKTKDGFNFSDSDGTWWAEHRVGRLNAMRWATTKRAWTRAVRAIVLLQQIGSTEALAIVSDIATGNPDAVPTKVAKDPAYAGEQPPATGN